MEPPPTSTTAPEKSTPQSSPAPDPPENLTRELMVSLSKEMDTTMTSIMAFRIRVGFGMFVGPFVLLGSFIVGAKGQPVAFNLTWAGWTAIGVILACFLAIGFIVAKIEHQAYDQCNTWRGLIMELRQTPSLKIDPKELVIMPRPYWGYLGSFLLLFVSVVAAAFIIKNAGVETPKSPGSGPTFRIEQVSPTEH